MTAGASIATIKAGLEAAYESISLPGGLGAPTAVTREPDGNPPSLPYIEIYTNPTRRIHQPNGEDSYTVSRIFIARLYVARLDDDTPSVKDADYIKAENCIETVEDYFILTEPRLNVAFVKNHTITADTAAVDQFTRANRNYVGVAFEHLVEYLRMR